VIQYVYTLTCENRPGIVAAVATCIFEHGGNVRESQQFDDIESGRFFARIVLDHPKNRLDLDGLREDLGVIAKRFEMTWSLRDTTKLHRVMLLVSKSDHCLTDVLYRWRIGELRMEVAAVVSNHPRETYQHIDLDDVAFHYLPITKETKAEQEAAIWKLVQETGTDLVILARYMQVLSDGVCRHLEGRAINIHHSFLPSFKGAKPYHQAHERGVKIIGATAHYVTAALDEGPIIEQDVARVDHSMDVNALAALGRDVESVVLARAVQWHAQRRVLVDGNKTVVFR
jgi:formyltetrahydrofolate deformylase